MDRTDKAARDILDLLIATYQPAHRFVKANPADFPHLDIDWYDRTARVLADRGFRSIADVEDKTITEAPGSALSAVLVRTMHSADGTIVTGLYHPHVRRFGIRALLWLTGQLPKKVSDFETEFTDGGFVATTNATGAAAIGNPPMIHSEYLPLDTAALEVLARHRARVAEYLASRPGVSARVVTSLAEMIESQNRQNALKAAYRGELRGITREEMDQLATFGTRGLARRVHAAMQDERAAGQLSLLARRSV